MEGSQRLWFCFKDEASGGFVVIIAVSERERLHTTVIAPLEPAGDEIDSSDCRKCPAELESYLRRKMLARLSRRSGVSCTELQHEAAQAVGIFTARYPRWWLPKAEASPTRASRSGEAAEAPRVLVDSERVLQLDALAAVSSGSILPLFAARPPGGGTADLDDRAARALVGAEGLSASAFLIGSAAPDRMPSSSPAPASRMEPALPAAAADEDSALHPSVAAWRRRRQGHGSGSPASTAAVTAGGKSASTAAGLAYAQQLGAFSGERAGTGGAVTPSAAASMRRAPTALLPTAEESSPMRDAAGIRTSSSSSSVSGSATGSWGAAASPPPTPSSVRDAARRAGGAVTRELLAGRLVRDGYREYIACAGSPEQRRLRVALVATAMEHPRWHSPASLASNSWFQGPFYSGSPPAVVPSDGGGSGGPA